MISPSPASPTRRTAPESPPFGATFPGPLPPPPSGTAPPLEDPPLACAAPASLGAALPAVPPLPDDGLAVAPPPDDELAVPPLPDDAPAPVVGTFAAAPLPGAVWPPAPAVLVFEPPEEQDKQAVIARAPNTQTRGELDRPMVIAPCVNAA